MDAKFADQIPDSIVLNISQDKDFITKPELFMLDLLSGYQWDRPINMLSMGGDLNIGIKEYLEYEGYSFKLVPIKSKTSQSQAGFVDTDELYRKMTEVYKWDALSADDYFIDYQNQYTHLGVLSIRNLFVTCARAFMKAGENGRALEMLDRCEEVMRNYPLETIPLGFSGNDYMVIEAVSCYYELGQPEKAFALAERMGGELLVSARFYLQFYDWAMDELDLTGNYIYFLADEMKKGGNAEAADKLTGDFVQLVDAAARAYGAQD